MDKIKSLDVFEFPESEDPLNKAKAKPKQRSWRKNKNKEIQEKENLLNAKSNEESNSMNNMFCPICKMKFPKDLDENARTLHISKCNDSEVTKNADKPCCSKNVSSICPVCNKDFTASESAHEKEIHINKCLDLSLNPNDANDDELLARSLQNEESMNGPLTADVECCVICFRDMSRYTIQQRTKHINNCADKHEKVEGKNKRKNPTRKAKSNRQRSSKNVKKPCPICKAEHPENKFNAHLKKCASKNKISPHQLLQIIREHNIEQESNEKAGTSSNSSLPKATTTVVKPSDIDIMEKSIIQEHMNLLEEEHDEIPSTPALPRSRLQKDKPCSSSSLSNKSIKIDDNAQKKRPCPLWNLAAYDLTVDDSIFLLTELHPGLYREPQNDECDDSKIVQLPDKNEKAKDENEEDGKEIVETKMKNTNSNDSFTATQFEKLDILINLDANSSNEEEIDKDGFMADDLSEKIDKLQHESNNRISSGYVSLVASPVCSDFVLHCRDGEDIPAHKVILATFCEAFKKIIIDDQKNSLDLQEFSPINMKTVMNFIYAGVLPEPFTLSPLDLNEVKMFASRYSIGILYRYCELIQPLPKEKTNTDKMKEEDDNLLDLNDIVSTFWQNEAGEENQTLESEEEEREKKNNDSAFSADELIEMREIFQSQRCVTKSDGESEGRSVSNDGEIDGDGLAKDDCFFVPDINKTLERSRFTSDEEARSQIEGDLLGESPGPSRNSTRLNKLNKNIDTLTSTSSSSSISKKFNSFECDPNKGSLILTGTSSGSNISKKLNSFESEQNKGSLDVVPPTSPKPELSVESFGPVPINSYNSNIDSSAYADTQPISENSEKIRLFEDSPSNPKINSEPSTQLKIRSSGFKMNDKRTSVKLKLNCKNKKRSSSSILDVTNDPEPERVELDQSSQEKMKCKEVTKVGTLTFSQEDFHSILGGYSTAASVGIEGGSTESDTEGWNTEGGSICKKKKEEHVSAEKDDVETNTSDVVLFPEGDEGMDQTPPLNLDETAGSPALISFETPSMMVKKDNIKGFDNDQDGYVSNHSLDDIEIPGLNRLSDCKTDKKQTLIPEDSQNYNADFTVTSSRINDPSMKESFENIITIDDNTQETEMANMPLPEPNINETVKWPSFVKASELTTSTPYQCRDGSSKKPLSSLQNQFKAETPIKGTKEKSPESKPDSTVVVVESQSLPSKRQISSSSSTEDISSSCESNYLTSSQKKRRQKKTKAKVE